VSGASRKGRAEGQKTPFTERQVEMIDAILAEDKSLLAIRNRALMRTSIDTMLRGNDVLKLTVGDVSYRGEVRDEFFVKMKKTKKTVKCQLLPKAQKAVAKWLAISGKDDPSERVFPITLRQYSRVVKSFAEMLRLDPRIYSTHSMRRTKPAIIYAKTKNIAVVKRLLGHAGLQATSEYLGVDAAEAFAVAREFDI
jgi:integrase